MLTDSRDWLRCSAGFTLLEIMLAMLVLAMVVSMVSLTLSGSIKAIDATMDQGDVYYRAQIAMERISEDLSSALLPADVEFIGNAGEDDNGAAASLSFASLAHVVFNAKSDQPGLGLIGYTVRADKEDEQQLLLLRTDILYRPLADEQGSKTQNNDVEAFLLCDRLRSVKFSFVDHNGEVLENWNTRVDPDDKDAERWLPVAVSCRLEFWINQDEESSVSFETTVILPVGMIQAEDDQENRDAA